MPEHVRVDALGLQRSAALGRGDDVCRDATLDGVAAQTPAGARREQRVVWPAAAFCEPLPEHGDGLAGQRRRTVFAAFAEYLDVRAGGEVHVLAAQAGELADAQPGLDREREQGVIATSEPSILVGGGQERVDLVGGEVGDCLLYTSPSPRDRS